MESPLKGKVLIASPELTDPNFARSVVLIVQHDENGAMGLVINRAFWRPPSPRPGHRFPASPIPTATRSIRAARAPAL